MFKKKKFAKWLVGASLVAGMATGGGVVGAKIQKHNDKKAYRTEQTAKDQQILKTYDENTIRILSDEEHLQRQANEVMMDIWHDMDSVVNVTNDKTYADITKQLSKSDIQKLRIEGQIKLNSDELERVIRHCGYGRGEGGKTILYIDGATFGMGLDWEGEAIGITQTDGKTDVLDKIISLHEQLNKQLQRDPVWYEHSVVYWRDNDGHDHVDYHKNMTVYDFSSFSTDFIRNEREANDAEIFWNLVKATPETETGGQMLYEGTAYETYVADVNAFKFGNGPYLDLSNPYVQKYLNRIYKIIDQAKQLQIAKENRAKIVAIQKSGNNR